MTFVVPNIDKRFQTRDIVFELAEQVSNNLTIGRFIPKKTPEDIEVDSDDDFIEILRPKKTWKEALESGDFGNIHNMAENGQYNALGVREYSSDTLNIEWIGGSLEFTPKYFKQIFNDPQKLIRDVAPMFSQLIDKRLYDSLTELKGESGISTYTQDEDETYNSFLISANAKYTKQRQHINELDTMLVSNESIEAIAKEAEEISANLMPVEEIKKLYGVNGIRYPLQETNTFKGGELMSANEDKDGKETLGFRRADAPLNIVYLTDPTFSAVPSDMNMQGTEFDFTPIVEYKQQYIEKPLPDYYKLYFKSRFAVLKDDPSKLFVGSLKYDQT